jgi:hypothetical protein
VPCPRRFRRCQRPKNSTSRAHNTFPRRFDNIRARRRPLTPLVLPGPATVNARQVREPTAPRLWRRYPCIRTNRASARKACTLCRSHARQPRAAASESCRNLPFANSVSANACERKPCINVYAAACMNSRNWLATILVLLLRSEHNPSLHAFDH